MLIISLNQIAQGIARGMKNMPDHILKKSSRPSTNISVSRTSAMTEKKYIPKNWSSEQALKPVLCSLQQHEMPTI